MPREDRRIEPAREEDRPALYDICLKTAAAGNDASHLYSDPELPGQFWVLPYATIEPGFAFVLRGAGQVLGYVVGVPDTWAFVARLESHWWPALRIRYAGFAPKAELDAAALERLARPETPDDRLRAFPAHMHINLRPEARRDGWGRRMVERELLALRAAGAPAVHLGVSTRNDRVLPFYAKLGFRRLHASSSAIYMGREL